MKVSTSTRLATVLALAALPALARADAPAFHRGPNACGTPQVRGGIAPTPRRPASAPRVIYMNKNGGTYNIVSSNSPVTNSATNTAWAQIMGVQGSKTLSPMSTQFDWNSIVQCVRDFYAPFNVTVTDVEPTSGTYVEAVVAGNASQLGFDPQSGILGIASADYFCSVTENGIAFSLANEHLQFGSQYMNKELCNTVAHEVGHILGLEHEQLHDDLMCYDFEPFQKDFLDQAAPCGEYDTDFQQDPRQCSCGGSSTNSRDRLVGLVGLSNPETTPPTVDITSPANGAKVPPGFAVDATASDNDQLSSVTLFVDDVMAAVDPVAPYHLLAPNSLTAGNHTVVVEAKDRSGNTARDQITVEVGSGCDCGADYECIDNQCKLKDGRGCADSAECAGGICAGGGPNGNFCTEVCDLNADSCPQGFDCVAVSDTAVCAPNGEPTDEGGGGDGCGCVVGGRDDLAGGTALGLFFGLGLVLAIKRRRNRN